MKVVRLALAAGLVVVFLPLASSGSEGGLPFRIFNRLRLEYDDNIRQEEENTDESWKIIEEAEFSLDANLDDTFLGLRYRPSFVWWDDRPEDETDFHHAVDLVFNHKFSPRFSLGLKDTLRRAELPELVEEGRVVRENNDYLYNSFEGGLTTVLRPDTRMDFSGRYLTLRYDDDDVADREDYDIYVAGLTIYHNIVPESSIGMDLRFQTADYKSTLNRDSDDYQVGAAFQQVFNPNLFANLRVGYERKDLDEAQGDTQDTPYGEISVTFLPSPATRLTGGAGYSLFETDVYPFGNQTRTRMFANLAHDLTAKISVYLSGIYTKGDYDGDDLPQGATLRDLPAKVIEEIAPGVTGAALDAPLTEEFIDAVSDKSEDIYQVSARVTYKVNRANWLEAGWQYSKLDSDLREDFERNRIHVGWKLRL